MKTNRMRRPIWFLSGAVALCATAHADVKMPALFGDNMVLQRGVNVPIWGEAAPGEKVTVKLFNQSKEATASATGRWMVKLDPLDVNEGTTLQINGNNEIKINNVAVGEVWLASGQSNMEFRLNNAKNAQESIAASTDPLLRSFTVNKATSETPLTDVKGNWQIAGPTTSGGFSAVGYFFARELRKKLNVPVGLIHSSWGGTPAEAWASLPALQADADFKPMLEGWDKRIADYPAAMEKYKNETLVKWQAEADKAKAEGKPETQKPRAPDATTSPNRPANLYNAMLAPLVPYAMKGAIWYQGESNAGRAYQYRKLLPAMIADWRKAWDAQKPQDFGFYIVQLANFKGEKAEPGDSDWAELREAQTLTANMPGNGQGLAIDIGEAGDIHPKNKLDVGLRLAAAALAQTYGQKIEYSGPIYSAMSKDGNKIRLKFTHVDDLMTKVPDRSTAEVLPDQWTYKALNALSKAGIVEGTTQGTADGAYNGNKTITRGEFARAIARTVKVMLDMPITPLKSNPIEDVGPREAIRRLSPAAQEERREIEGTLRALQQEFQPELRKLGLKVGDAQGFAIAGEDKKWKWATAKIEGNEIVVWNDEIAAPVAVRYAWADNPKATIYNAAGLPAVPFRTDDWPGVTVNNK